MKKLSREAKKCFQRWDIPELEEKFRNSLLVPQRGRYHQEGPMLKDHLAMMLWFMTNRYSTGIAVSYPEDGKQVIENLFKKLHMHEELMRLVYTHILLHDVAKMDCMQFIYRDGTKEFFPFEKWERILEENEGDAERALDSIDVVQVSYPQHGKLAAEYLKKLADKYGIKGRQNGTIRS